MARQADRRADLVSQSWPAFFRSLAVEIAIIAVIVAAIIAWLLLTR